MTTLEKLGYEAVELKVSTAMQNLDVLKVANIDASRLEQIRKTLVLQSSIITEFTVGRVPEPK